ncbi:MAG: hypothetical protein M3Q73_01620 [bacterium]|nr:hypothetical protein [bacterium]
MEQQPYNNEIPEQKSIETLQEEFSKRLDRILYKELTVENIETFADEALSEVIQLIDDALTEYRNNPLVEGNLSLDTRSQEDDVCTKLNLPNLSEILDSITKTKDRIEALRAYLRENVQIKEDIITPPDSEIIPDMVPDEEAEKFEEKKLFPRTLTLMYILEHDMDIESEHLTITQGTTTPQMMRNTPYVRVEIPDLERVVYICDEEGNASYVFNTEIIESKNLKIDEIDLDSKDEKNTLIAQHSGIGIRIIQTNHWRNEVSHWLQNSLPESIEAKDSVLENEVPKSEFVKEKKNFLSFDDFQSDVISSFYQYNGDKSVRDWYRIEYKNHKNWPRNPDQSYKNKGWSTWPELVGREKKEFLDFDDFVTDVRSFYPGEGDVKAWYQIVYKEHKNWPAGPSTIYKDKGWVGWSELVDRENFLKKEFLPFEDFQNEVRRLYPGTVNVQKWYSTEYKNHKNWPSHPSVTYKDKGWIDWSELAGNENRLKKEFLSYEDFQNEVKSLYEQHGGEKSIRDWYKIEYKNHKNWPSNPDNMYKDKGWNNWSSLVN